MFFNSLVRQQFQLVYDGSLPLLTLADLFYAFHGLLLQCILLTQVIFGNYLWKFKNERRSYNVYKFTKVIIIAFACYLLIIYVGFSTNKELELCLNLATLKIFASLIKYIPQVRFNMRRRSMYGISRIQVYLDASGAILCLSEFFIKNNLPITEAINSNRGKVGIAVITLLFASIFIFQFSLYTDQPPELKKNDIELGYTKI